MIPTQEAGKRIVSKGRYAAMKTLAFGLSGGLYVCFGGIALLVANVPYAGYLDARQQSQMCLADGLPANCTKDFDLWFTASGLASIACTIFIPPLLIGAYLLWLGSRKSWKTVRVMEPIHRANTGRLPAAESLVRASAEPLQAQEAVLLRAATQGQETPAEQLVRASARQE